MTQQAVDRRSGVPEREGRAGRSGSESVSGRARDGRGVRLTDLCGPVDGAMLSWHVRLCVMRCGRCETERFAGRRSRAGGRARQTEGPGGCASEVT